MGDEDADDCVVDDIQNAVVADAEAADVRAVGRRSHGAWIVGRIVDGVRHFGETGWVLPEEPRGRLEGVRFEDDLAGHGFSSPNRSRTSAMGIPSPSVPSALRRW